MLYIDLDRFKEVNDTLGHACGDMLLRAAADRVRGCLRETDTVARLGGDEFAVLHTGPAGREYAAQLAERLIEAISAPYDLGGHPAAVGASIGIALATAGTADPDHLIRNADLALYDVKSDGRGTYRFFEPAMDASLQARRALDADLRKALANGEFELHYQPLMNLRTGRMTAVEALLRWNHPTRGQLPPQQFIPFAEETGLIVPIGEWVLRQACMQTMQWPPDIGVAVNLSAVQFKNQEIVTAVSSALTLSGLPASRLELEVTESVLLQDDDPTLMTLRKLRSLGVRIALDDFGTGFSSLSYLRSFPFDKIKIDRSFVHELSTDPESSAIVRAVAGLGKSLGIATTAEGVETAEQLERVRSEGCTEAQGYFFSPARPAADIDQLLRALAPAAEKVA